MKLNPRIEPNNGPAYVHAIGHNNDSLYLRSGERMTGTEGLTAEEAAIFIAECEADERADFGKVVTTYTYVPGDVFEHVPTAPQCIEVTA
jgi:hypothetical protein